MTHPDTDHYNDINKVLLELNDEATNSRIAYWIFSNAYGPADIGAKDASLITKKRFVVTPEFVRDQTDDQTIHFVNAPQIEKGDKNANSMMLRVTMGSNGRTNRVLLTGDATARTIADIKKSSEKLASIKGYPSNWMERLEWKLLTNIDYMVVPHHGANTFGSDLIIQLAGTIKGFIFSSPMYSHHGHPSLDAVASALKFSAKNGSSSQANEHLIYIQLKDGMSEDEIEEKLKDTDTTKILCYAFGTKAEFNREEFEDTLSLPYNYPRKPNHCLFKTSRSVFITGVSGDIGCDQDGCQPRPIPLSEPIITSEEAFSLSMDESDIKSFVQNKNFASNAKQYVYTKFSQNEMVDLYNRKMVKLGKPPIQAKSLKDLSVPSWAVKKRPTRSLSVMKIPSDDADFDWNELFDIWERDQKSLIERTLI